MRIVTHPSLGHEIGQVVGCGWVASRGGGVRPIARVAVHAVAAEMLEGVRGEGDCVAGVEDEGLFVVAVAGGGGAFGDHRDGGEEAKLLVDAGAEVGVAERVEERWVGPGNAGGWEQGVEGAVQTALGVRVEGKEDEEVGYAVRGRFVAG